MSIVQVQLANGKIAQAIAIVDADGNQILSFGGSATATNGDTIDLVSWPTAYAYNGDGTLNYQTVTSPAGNSYRQTMTYSSGAVATRSGWVMQ